MESKSINIELDYNSGDGYLTYNVNIIVSYEEDVFVMGDIYLSNEQHPTKLVRNSADIAIIDRIVGIAIRNGFFDKPYGDYSSEVMDGSDYELTIKIGNKKRTLRDYASSAPEYVQQIEELIEDSCLSERFRVKSKPRKCPKCGGKQIRTIVYGMPSYEMQERAEQGEFILGGCCVSEDSPSWRCCDCGAEFIKESV